ncbi:MAG: rod shape-determining protein MreC [Clostridia bacterium]
MRFLKSRRFQIIAVAVLMLVIALVSADRFSEVNIIRNIVTAPVTFVQKLVVSIKESVDDFFAGIKEYNAIKEENEELRSSLAQMVKQVNMLMRMEEENVRLRNALALKRKFSDFEIVGGNVLGSGTDSFTFEFRIDIGRSGGVYIDAPVLSEDNYLVGRIHTVGFNSSTVITIMDETSGISGWITKEEGGHVAVRGDIRHRETNLCMVESIPHDLEIRVGDQVETSGLGGIYPKGILIGEVVAVFKEENRMERYALMRPYVNFYTLREVYVLKEQPKGE